MTNFPVPAASPASGPWAASYRVMFALVAAWCALVVPLWHWLGIGGPGFHVHEMVVGIGGGALAAYLPTACSSWTGRPPVAGRPVQVLVGLWVLSRALMSAPPGLVPAWVVVPVLIGFFWWIGLVVAGEIRRSGRQVGIYPLGLVAFCVLAGVGSGMFGWSVVTGRQHDGDSNALVMFFVVLLVGVGSRMVPAFLNSAIERHGHPPRVVSAVPRRAALACCVLAVGTTPWPEVSATAAVVAGLLVLVHMLGWPVAGVRYDALAAMTFFAFGWLPTGLVLWGGARLGLVPIWPSAASHALTMGGLCGLVIAVMARASAHRGDGRLHVRWPALGGFLLVMAAVPCRLAELHGPAAALWSGGWVLVLAAHATTLAGALARPVFSARRAEVLTR